jgi:phosphate transport system substrate-binding protein
MNPHLSRSAPWARRSAVATVVALFAVVAGAASPAFADYAQIDGDGSTWSKVIVDQWIADVKSSGIQANYTGTGSSTGRQNFANFQDDFAISEIPYQGTDERGAADGSPNRPYAYLPIVAGGTSFTYHIEVGGALMRDVRLSGETIAKIFTNTITNWSDPQIKADNNGRVFPDLQIVPVVRSDGSGTTAQFTTWMDNQYPSLWRPYNKGKAGLTSYYPTTANSKMLSAPGSDQVMNTIVADSGNGTIGYVEYSYPLNMDYPVVKVLNAAGYYVEPTEYDVAVALTKAKINEDATSALYLTQILDGVYTNPDPRAYPLSSYSYMIIPTAPSGTAPGQETRMTTAKRQSLADFMFHGLCEGQKIAGAYGYSPMPLNLVQAGFDQLAKLKTADPNVDLQKRDVTQCNNPTFVAGNLGANHLADIAPQPAVCDKAGAGPCLGANGAPGGAAPGAGSAAGAGAAGSAAASAGVANTVAGGAAAAGSTVGVDPETGLGTGADVSAAGGLVTGAVATRVAARQAGGGIAFGALAAAELVGIILVPGALTGWVRRRRVGA